MFVVNLAVSDCLMMTTMGPPVTINAFAKVCTFHIATILERQLCRQN
jgi:hypothetical protein